MNVNKCTSVCECVCVCVCARVCVCVSECMCVCARKIVCWVAGDCRRCNILSVNMNSNNCGHIRKTHNKGSHINTQTQAQTHNRTQTRRTNTNTPQHTPTQRHHLRTQLNATKTRYRASNGTARRPLWTTARRGQHGGGRAATTAGCLRTPRGQTTPQTTHKDQSHEQT